MSKIFGRTLAACTLLALLFAALTRVAWAQSPPQQPPNPNPSSQQTSSKEIPAPQAPAPQARVKPDPDVHKQASQGNPTEENSLATVEPPKRMFGMIPDFESAADTPQHHIPLTVGEKYILSLHQAFDFSAHIGNAFQAGIQQATNTQPHFGHSWAAYGQRFAAAEGDQVTGSILIYGFFPSVLHEDPRYFRQGRGSAGSRLWYAVTRTFVVRRDDGTNGFNRSQTLGQLISCGISTSYYPSQDRSVGGVFLNWAVNLGYNSGYNMLTEYYTDLLHAVFHQHKNLIEDPANSKSSM